MVPRRTPVLFGGSAMMRKSTNGSFAWLACLCNAFPVCFIALLVGEALAQEKKADASKAESGIADRLARVTGAGRKTEKERDPVGYKKLEEEIERAVRRAAAWLKKQERLDPIKLTDKYPTIGI